MRAGAVLRVTGVLGEWIMTPVGFLLGSGCAGAVLMTPVGFFAGARDARGRRT